MSWKDRLRGSIELTSPDGDVFTANWIGGDISKDKKIGRFDLVNTNGSIIQDLGINSSSIPLEIHFSGDDNDIEARRFYASCNQRGIWAIVHPTEGNLSLQLISVSWQIRPVESGNITIFATEWIEPLTESILKSTTQLGAEVENQAQEANISAANQYADNLSLDSASEIIANKQVIENTVIEADSALNKITSTSDTISAEITAIENSIAESLSSGTIDLLSIAGQIQQIIQLPVLASNDIQARVNAYLELSANMFNYLPEDNSIESKNTAVAAENTLSSCLVAVSRSMVTGELSTRTETVNFINKILELFTDITNNLDDVQAFFESNTIDTQYFSQSGSYAELLKLVGNVISYLLQSSLDLKIEKRFIIDRQRSPIEITVTEYGSLGDNDELLDFFIATNELMGNDILLLPAGREVVVYV